MTTKDSYFMDIENYCLRHFNTSILEEGRGRSANPEWGKMIKMYIECPYSEYVEWVEGGGGDDWFVEYH